MFKKTPEWFSSIFLSGAKVGQIMGKSAFKNGFFGKLIHRPFPIDNSRSSMDDGPSSMDQESRRKFNQIQNITA